MQPQAVKFIQSLENLPQLTSFASRLTAWLLSDLNPPTSEVRFTESRARAVLHAANVLDEPTWHSFQRLVETPLALRLALYDLLIGAELAGEKEVEALVVASTAAANPTPVEWLLLCAAAFAWKRGYFLDQLDPSSPPLPDSPAGQILSRAMAFIRQQVQRGATERDKLARKLEYQPGGAISPSLETMPSAQETIAPLPPYYRPPIPVRYSEVARETLHVTPPETSASSTPSALPAVNRGTPIVISREEVEPTPNPPTRMPQITISREQVEGSRPPSPLPASAVIMPNSAVEPKPSLTVAFRQMFRNEPMKTTKLRVMVQEYPDGPGLYGLQVRVTCPTIRSYVAGTTDRSGKFLCELPVRLTSGLTYDIDVTWPREHSGETERKSITLNADRTEFALPFYRRLTQ
ncbi:MAG: hypothetical protein V9G20_13955 [Candidatus Promineifilaceae bacterium]